MYQNDNGIVQLFSRTTIYQTIQLLSSRPIHCMSINNDMHRNDH